MTIGKRPKRHGRRKPYTEMGIARVPCCRCGKPASRQWQACADGNLYRPVCTKCDIELNRLALTFMLDPDVEAKIKAYRERMGV